jgi:hypothetical protein
LGPLASLSRVDACNPLLQAHPTWAWDEHKGRGIPTSLTPVSGRLAPSPFVLAHALDPSGLGHAATLTRRPEGPPGLETPTVRLKFNVVGILVGQHFYYQHLITKYKYIPNPFMHKQYSSAYIYKYHQYKAQNHLNQNVINMKLNHLSVIEHDLFSSSSSIIM